MNAVFHLVSAAAGLILVLLLLRAQRQRQFLRDLLLSQQVGKAQRVVVATPIAFLEQFAYAVSVPFENGATQAGAPGKMDPKVWTEIFLQGAITLIRCQDGQEANTGPLIEVCGPAARLPADLSARLGAALGGKASVRLLPQAGLGRPSC